MSEILVVTTPDVPGRQVDRVIGLVRGNTVRARHIGKDIMAGLKTIVGGEIHEYGKLLAESREQALDRMVAEAESLGANAVLNVRFATSMVMQGSAEMLAYGTAVVLQDE
ncbi:MAG: YbjQ family protein [Pirellulaceae bacterium]|nr:YbjQ family protein [Pirellulaceae bacterium]